MAANDDAYDLVNPPVGGVQDEFGQIDQDAANLVYESRDCGRCVQYREQEAAERAISPDNFNLTMFKLKCWTKDLYDILSTVDDDIIPDGEGEMRNYIYDINRCLSAYFATYR